MCLIKLGISEKHTKSCTKIQMQKQANLKINNYCIPMDNNEIILAAL